ncbi:MAG: hypothetical protein ACTSR3_02370 [Candidatus Helarchaeota archaeon]
MDITYLKKNAEKTNECTKAVIKFLLNCLYFHKQSDNIILDHMGCVIAKRFCQENSSTPYGWKLTKKYSAIIKRVNEEKNTNCALSNTGAAWEKDYKDIEVNKHEPKQEDSKQTMEGKRIRIFINTDGRDHNLPVNIQ